MLQLASSADRAGVNALAAQVHGLHVAWRPDIFCSPGQLFPEQRYQQALQERSLYVAKLDDTVIGYVLLRIRSYDHHPGLINRRVMVLEELCVEQSLRGHGFGTAMVEDVHALARAFRCTDLQLGVYPQNDEAVGFWQKCGFTIRSIEMQKKV